jgi:hypothetical protein
MSPYPGAQVRFKTAASYLRRDGFQIFLSFPLSIEKTRLFEIKIL